MTAAEQSAYNMRTLAANVRSRMALPDSPSAWTYQQRIEYNKQLAAEIAARPQSFTPEVVGLADSIQGKSYEPLEDPSLAWGEFAADLAPRVAFSLSTLVLVVAAVAAAAYFLPSGLARAKAK